MEPSDEDYDDLFLPRRKVDNGEEKAKPLFVEDDDDEFVGDDMKHEEGDEEEADEIQDELDKEDYQDEPGPEADDEQFVVEFGAFGEGGRVGGGRMVQFAESEIEQFWLTMEKYANTKQMNFDRQNNFFLNLALNYPHPAKLSPELCNLMPLFYNAARNTYEWRKDIYERIKDNRIDSIHILRYIHLFNEFAL
jgi:hypothetical protein